MNKLPKEIYVHEDGDNGTFFITAQEAARPGETITLAVYKLVGKVEVSTQIKQEIIVKKSPTGKKKPVEVLQDRDALLETMRT